MIALASCAILALMFVSSNAATYQLGYPALACTAGSTDFVSIDLTVTAATPYGAPGGFSVQYMSKAEFDANMGWYLSDDTRLCKMSFAGQASNSNGNNPVYDFNLNAGETVEITIGDDLPDTPGASGSGPSWCTLPLQCNTEYVVHTFAHNFVKQPDQWKKSIFGPDVVCKTAACPATLGCTYTQGYWKSHGENPYGQNSDEWPMAVGQVMLLGTREYNQVQLQQILEYPGASNYLPKLAHQLIAAKLNLLNGAGVGTTDIEATITAADAAIDSLKVPYMSSIIEDCGTVTVCTTVKVKGKDTPTCKSPQSDSSICSTAAAAALPTCLYPQVDTGLCGAGVLSSNDADLTALNNALDLYNNGLADGGPEHCNNEVLPPA